MKAYKLWTTFLLILFFNQTIAQSDSLILTNGNIIIGKAKSMDRGVLTYDTDYADSDFKISWNKVNGLFTETVFFITLTSGDRYTGHIESIGPKQMVIVSDEGEKIEVKPEDIVYLDDLDEGFWSQLYASIDVGFDLTKANDFKQVSMRSNVGYTDKRWNIDATYNTLNSSQSDVPDIKRTDGGMGFRWYLPRDWYPLFNVTFLSNTEQKLDLRTSVKAGMGKYIIHTNHSYWGFSGGANYNNENFSSDDADRESWEGFLGTELNLYDIGDLNLLTKLIAYPSFTEAGRWRADFNIDAKYDMPFDDDFYIKVGLTYNYDNQPVSGASESDYVFYTGFGWEW